MGVCGERVNKCRSPPPMAARFDGAAQDDCPVVRSWDCLDLFLKGKK